MIESENWIGREVVTMASPPQEKIFRDKQLWDERHPIVVGIVEAGASSPHGKKVIRYEKYKQMSDEEFLSLDYQAMKVDVVLPKLERILFTGNLNSSSFSGWLYVIYALGRLGDKRAIMILEKFLADRIDYKFDNIREGIIKTNVAAALEKLRNL
ncbi:MAG TPA: hypothetical protein VHL11_20675 [Phototrophicaceae bacterium]|nr:hypothetical protein [Phototrophicaceae bacterium]